LATSGEAADDVDEAAAADDDDDDDDDGGAGLLLVLLLQRGATARVVRCRCRGCAGDGGWIVGAAGGKRWRRAEAQATHQQASAASRSIRCMVGRMLRPVVVGDGGSMVR